MRTVRGRTQGTIKEVTREYMVSNVQHFNLKARGGNLTWSGNEHRRRRTRSKRRKSLLQLRTP
jgi:hypothetical protein